MCKKSPSIFPGRTLLHLAAQSALPNACRLLVEAFSVTSSEIKASSLTSATRKRPPSPTTSSVTRYDHPQATSSLRTVRWTPVHYALCGENKTPDRNATAALLLEHATYTLERTGRNALYMGVLEPRMDGVLEPLHGKKVGRMDGVPLHGKKVVPPEHSFFLLLLAHGDVALQGREEQQLRDEGCKRLPHWSWLQHFFHPPGCPQSGKPNKACEKLLLPMIDKDLEDFLRYEDELLEEKTAAEGGASSSSIVQRSGSSTSKVDAVLTEEVVSFLLIRPHQCPVCQNHLTRDLLHGSRS